MVAPETLEAQAATIERVAAQYESLVGRLRAQRETLEGQWSDRARAVFDTTTQRCEAEALEICQSLETTAAHLRSVAQMIRLTRPS